MLDLNFLYTPQILRCYIVWDSSKSVLITASVSSVFNNAAALVAWILSISRHHNSLTSGSPVVFLFFNFALNLTLSLTIAGKIWKTGHTARQLLGTKLRQTYRTAFSITLESGILYSVAIISCAFLGGDYNHVILLQMAGIAPTMIVVRAGLGVKGNNIHVSTGSTLRPNPGPRGYTEDISSNGLEGQTPIQSQIVH
ncbi:hypothetical protein K435DRAFT_881596 [Dendrothele bispora CBS 962.96]|uniref:Uncharacterized protein n=1 Tax=Dendrothele bispora (strain CBS 962.96) TaxID=1314807 RepID=A0A4S8KI88_DENBC|nr:hypothetical protein K435DRAFT_881596 [Dendrothele bispora CBS 962.96]